MAFQRSHSKVWWGNFAENSILYNNGGGFHSLDSNLKYSGNLSRIQESADESSRFWENNNHESPGSLKSQDSGFSDNDESHTKDLKSASPNITTKSQTSLTSIKTIETPPTVIRRKIDTGNLFDTVSRRISFSAPSSPTNLTKDFDILHQIDKISLVTTQSTKPNNVLEKMNDIKLLENPKTNNSKSIKKRRVLGGDGSHRRLKPNLLDKDINILSLSSSSSSLLSITSDRSKDYNNETVYFGGIDDNLVTRTTPIKNLNKYTVNTSTPNSNYLETYLGTSNDITINGICLPEPIDELPSVQQWLYDIRDTYEHEVMSTLQTKSIVQEAFRNLKITTTIVTKIIRQLQQRSIIIQGEFERCEKSYKLENRLLLKDCLITTQDLLGSVTEFIKILERRSVFFIDSSLDRKQFIDNIENMKSILKDLRISLEKQHYLDLVTLSEDVQVLKRYLLLTIRLVFEKLIRILILNIENSKCDLMLRANLNMISTLSNMDYIGFASLTDGFLKNQTIRVLLLICLDNKFSSIRALALRALATICSTIESIRQFGNDGGIEIVKDILSCDTRQVKRTEPERREAVSLLTQITAPWHGRDHKVIGLKDSVESIVESLTDIIDKTTCCQTLLLCAASLNNLSHLEVTSIYSIMSNESVIKLKEAVEKRGPGVSIFLYEQIIAMLYNMSNNKKCHSHLANKYILNFITFIFQSQFYEFYKSRAEIDSHRKTIKTILHIFSKLIHESIIGQEILENNFIPIFSKVEQNLNNSEYSNDITYINRQLNESLTQKTFNRSDSKSPINSGSSSSCSTSKLNVVTRQESYV